VEVLVLSWERKTDLECPECGGILSYKLVRGEECTVNIEFFCESDKDNVFAFEIETGLSNEDIAKLEKGEVVKKEMTVKVVRKVPGRVGE